MLRITLATVPISSCKSKLTDGHVRCGRWTKSTMASCTLSCCAGRVCSLASADSHKIRPLKLDFQLQFQMQYSQFGCSMQRRFYKRDEIIGISHSGDSWKAQVGCSALLMASGALQTTTWSGFGMAWWERRGWFKSVKVVYDEKARMDRRIVSPQRFWEKWWHRSAFHHFRIVRFPQELAEHLGHIQSSEPHSGRLPHQASVSWTTREFVMFRN